MIYNKTDSIIHNVTIIQSLLGSAVNRPQFRQHTATNQHNEGKKTLTLPQPSIVDNNAFYDDDDEVDLYCLQASQQIEEIEKQNSTQHKTVPNDANPSYNSFISNAGGGSITSTQNHFPHKVNMQSTTAKPSLQAQQFARPLLKSSSALPLVQQASVTQPPTTSQKENISSEQFAMKQANEIKALRINVETLRKNNLTLLDKNNEKDGAVTNLRNEKKTLQEELRNLKLLNLKATQEKKVDADIEKLRKQVQDLKVQLEFQKSKETTHFKTPSAQLLSPVAHQSVKSLFFTNFSPPPLAAALDVTKSIFDASKSPSSCSELVKVSREREASTDLMQMQLRLAQVHATILIGGTIDKTALRSLFEDASYLIHRITDYIRYLEDEDEKPITFDVEHALKVYKLISIPVLRGKLTSNDSDRCATSTNKTCPSIFQAEKLFPDELCEKPRRIIACYATLARHSKSFSEKLLFENVNSDGTKYQTFVSMLVGSLEFEVSESNRVFDYFGFAVASASLLASLGTHYNDYNNNPGIDDVLYRLLRAVLFCRCDDPMLMVQVSEFLVQISKNPAKSGLITMLCTKHQRSEIVYSNKYKYYQIPHEVCVFHLFLMYLLTSFKFEKEMNQLELELLLQTTLNLNQIVSNTQEMSECNLKIPDVQEKMNESCRCFSFLEFAVLELNQLVMSYRNKTFKQKVPFVASTNSKYHESK